MLDATLAPVQRHDHLALFPPVVPDPLERSHRLLTEGLDAGSARRRRGS